MVPLIDDSLAVLIDNIEGLLYLGLVEFLLLDFFESACGVWQHFIFILIFLLFKFLLTYQN